MAGGAIDILVLEGDGIGPEITAATLAVLSAADARFKLGLAFETATVGWAAHKASGNTFPDAIEIKAKAADGVLLGPVSHNDYPPAAQGGLNPSGELRKRLDLYANIRPARSREGFPPRCGKPVDLVIVRENTEGFYADRSMYVGPGEFMPTPDLALAMRKITRAGSTRIAESAFKLAMQAAQESHLRAQGQCAARLRRALSRMHARGGGALSGTLHTKSASSTPWRRFWCATPASSMSSSPPTCTATFCPTRRREIAGSLGLAASLNAGADHGVAQAQHGSAPDIAGKNIANPASLIGSAAMLLAWLGERRGDKKLNDAALRHRRRARPRDRDPVRARPIWAANYDRCLRRPRRGGGDLVTPAVDFSEPFDVVVAGGGNAALCAAITAARAGCRVIVIEGAPQFYRGGNTRHTRNLRCRP